jgi:hypothetical protein
MKKQRKGDPWSEPDGANNIKRRNRGLKSLDTMFEYSKTGSSSAPKRPAKAEKGTTSANNKRLRMFQQGKHMFIVNGKFLI